MVALRNVLRLHISQEEDKISWNSPGMLTPCLPSASFSSVVNCTEPGHIENGIRQVLSSGPHRFSFQTAVSYRCNPGYYLLGTSSISCQGDGTWDRSLPKCLCEYLYDQLEMGISFQCTMHHLQHLLQFSWLHIIVFCFWSDWFSGALRPPQRAPLCPDLRWPSDSWLSHPLQLHQPAHHHRQHNPDVPAGRPVERLAATLFWYGKPSWTACGLRGMILK